MQTLRIRFCCPAPWLPQKMEGWREWGNEVVSSSFSWASCFSPSSLFSFLSSSCFLICLIDRWSMVWEWRDEVNEALLSLLLLLLLWLPLCFVLFRTWLMADRRNLSVSGMKGRKWSPRLPALHSLWITAPLFQLFSSCFRLYVLNDGWSMELVGVRGNEGSEWRATKGTEKFLSFSYFSCPSTFPRLSAILTDGGSPKVNLSGSRRWRNRSGLLSFLLFLFLLLCMTAPPPPSVLCLRSSSVRTWLMADRWNLSVSGEMKGTKRATSYTRI